MKPVVLIVGDSWACGEWDGGDPPKILHHGLEQFFKESGHAVINKKEVSGSNPKSINRLSEVLNQFFKPTRPALNISNAVIFFVLTEPLRNYPITFNTLKDDIVAHGGLFELQQHVLRKDFVILNQLAVKHNTVIHLIGGLSSVPAFVSEFANLNCLVQSWPKLLVGNEREYKHIDWDTFGIWGKWQAVLAQQLSYSSAIDQKVIDQLTILETQCRQVFLHPLFNPDGGHPNRTGHRILFDFICKKLEL